MDHNKGFDLETKNGLAQFSGLSVWSPKGVLVVWGFFCLFLVCMLYLITFSTSASFGAEL